MIPTQTTTNTMVEQLQIISDLASQQRNAQEEPVLANLRSKSERMHIFPPSTESMDDWRQVNFRFRSYDFSILVRKYIHICFQHLVPLLARNLIATCFS